MDISKQWMLGRCASVGVNFLFADALGPKRPSWGSGLPSDCQVFLRQTKPYPGSAPTTRLPADQGKHRPTRFLAQHANSPLKTHKQAAPAATTCPCFERA